MKAHLPFQYRSRENAERYNALELFLFAVLYCLKTEFGFGETRLRRLAQTLSQFIKENENNNTWNDEIRYWAEKNGINDIFK